MVTTNDPDLASRLRLRRMYGMVSKDEFVTDGINTRLDELQAAILRVKLSHLDVMNERRRALASSYAAHLPASHVFPQVVRDGVRSVVHVYAACCAGRRDELLRALEGTGIQANVYYPLPLYRQRGFQANQRRAAVSAGRGGRGAAIIALPFYPEMEDSSLRAVADAVTMFFGS